MLRSHPATRIFSFLIGVTALLIPGCKKSAPPPSSQPQPATQTATPAAPSINTAQETAFVQGFYDWYQKHQGYDEVIAHKPEYFDAPLLAAFRNDIAIQARSTDGITGIDYDPFGYGQDGSNISGFKVVSATGDRVTVAPMDLKHQVDTKPADGLTLQVRCTAATCVIVNLFYTDNGMAPPNSVPAHDMLSDLAAMHPPGKPN